MASTQLYGARGSYHCLQASALRLRQASCPLLRRPNIAWVTQLLAPAPSTPSTRGTTTRARTMAARTAVAVALLAGTAEPADARRTGACRRRCPSRSNYNASLGWPVLDFSGAQLDAPLPKAHSSTRLHKRNISSTMRRRRLQAPDAHQGGLTPLFMGIGTHYAHVYVGTPAQRVSVIVDTGSHHTAFPCAGK